MDIDIKIRSCKGSCSRGVVHQLDLRDYEEQQKQLEQVMAKDLLPAKEKQHLPTLKMLPLPDLIPGTYKSQLQEAPPEWKALTEMRQMRMELEGLGKGGNSRRDSRGDSPTHGPEAEAESPLRPTPGVSEHRWPAGSQPGSEGSWSSSWAMGSDGRGGSGSSQSGGYRPNSSGSGNPMPSNPDWGEFSESTGSSSPAIKKEYHTGKLTTSKGDKELLIGNEKVTSSGTSTTRHSCSKTITKTVTGSDGRREVVKEVVTSDDPSDCGGGIDLGVEHNFGGRFDSFPQNFPDHAEFFGSHFDSLSSNFKEFGSKTEAVGSDIGLEDPGSHVPSYPSSGKTSTVRKQQITKTYKMADEAGSEAHDAGEARTTKRGRARSRPSRGIHT